ncbi:UNVERIFIED_CONTAM: hypothetical protein Slati_1754000 [Sesamum latifolium]|uniref:Reverse transcriptase zinc-binding domain-containing protein n=1 Tax=Sesamum latifolium TaxID=2727402 RepID=A0AAW2X2H0_9LAMI
MLAKQLWRILYRLDWLICRLLKAWYFPNYDILSAPLGRQPSFTWRSLMSAQALLRAGCRWRNWWEDILAWQFSSNGIFSVKSAYHLACDLDNRPCSNDLLDNKQGWRRKLWQAKLLNKIKCDGEDVTHTLISCSFARQILGLAHFSSSSIPRESLDVSHWFRLVASKLSPSDFGLFLRYAGQSGGVEIINSLRACWAIWWCRNKLFEASAWLLTRRCALRVTI